MGQKMPQKFPLEDQRQIKEYHKNSLGGVKEFFRVAIFFGPLCIFTLNFSKLTATALDPKFFDYWAKRPFFASIKVFGQIFQFFCGILKFWKVICWGAFTSVLRQHAFD